ncbi:hypothetical protein COOONC_00940 [Cooperia oncophora]
MHRQSTRIEKSLLLDLNRHLEADSNSLEISVIQWLTRIDARKEELLQQTALLSTPRAINSQSLSSGGSNCQEMLIGAITPQDRNIRVRRPLLEVPTFSGNFREFSTFWFVFESLIHNDSDLSDQEKFLFEALCFTSTGRVVQRPLNRLIPLEIRFSIHSSGTDGDLAPSVIGKPIHRRKTSTSSSEDPSVAVRHQPPRVAKTHVS